uniref:Replication factor C subunit 1 n=1 Tax=Crypthecodinium cohnii TaxID=2866 RepID=A0A516AGJ4_CRYCO|nr:replication factor C subunit 1 [Crypthecodinium cohnii]
MPPKKAAATKKKAAAPPPPPKAKVAAKRLVGKVPAPAKGSATAASSKAKAKAKAVEVPRASASAKTDKTDKAAAKAPAKAKAKAEAQPQAEGPRASTERKGAVGTATKRKAEETAPSSAAKRTATEVSTGQGDAASEGPASTNPLRDATVALTGELDGLTRGEIGHRLKAAGAKVMSSVSSKTTYLIVGSHLDDGRQVEETSKYRKYLELQSKGGKCPEVLREEQLLALLGASGGEKKVAAIVVAAPRTFESAKDQAVPWVERHKPGLLSDLLGNASGVKKLSTWLRDWDDVVLRGRKKGVMFKPGGGMPDNVNARAALVSGPPGIGKTTAARLVAKELGWTEVLEYNASDARGQKVINTMSDCLAGNRTLSFGKGGLGGLVEGNISSSSTKRCVIIMDEVDGLGAGDRGGNAALIKMIKNTKNPVICICNDHSSPKVRSLAFSCYDIRFARPTKTTIAQRAAEIAASEGLGVEANALEALAESCGNDIRHVLNQLQVLAIMPQYRSEILGYSDMQGRLSEISKDSAIMMNTFEACRNLLTASMVSKMKTRDRFDHFFLDSNIMHLFVQENYLNSVSKKPIDDDLLERCASSASSMAQGDLVNERVRNNQDWSLLPDMGTLSTVYPSFLTNGFVSFPDFPKFLGNYSKMGRAKRLSSELRTILRLFTTTQGRQLVTSGFSDVLYRRILQRLRDEEDVAGAAQVMDAYGLQREHIVEHLNELTSHLTGEDEYKLLDTKLKAAMTREMNRGSHAVRVFLPPVKRRRGVYFPEGDEGLGEDAEESKEAPAEEEAKEKDKEEDVLGGLVRKAKPAKSLNRKTKDSGGKVGEDEVWEPARPKETKSSSSTSVPKSKAAAKAKVPAKAKAKSKSSAKKPARK